MDPISKSQLTLEQTNYTHANKTRNQVYKIRLGASSPAACVAIFNTPNASNGIYIAEQSVKN